MTDFASAETWDVEMTSGVVRTMTLDELDAAYQDGIVGDETRVRQSGAPRWSTLAAVAGVEHTDQESYTPPPVNSLSPMQITVTVPPPAAVPREFAQLDLDEEEAMLRRGKKKPFAIAAGIVGIAALAGVVSFGVTRMSAASLAQAAAGAAVAAAPPAAESLPPAAETVTDKRNLSEDQKRALLEADQKRSAEADKKRAKSATDQVRQARPRSGKVNDGLLKGGDKFDPLNGAL